MEESISPTMDAAFVLSRVQPPSLRRRRVNKPLLRPKPTPRQHQQQSPPSPSLAPPSPPEEEADDIPSAPETPPSRPPPIMSRIVYRAPHTLAGMSVQDILSECQERKRRRLDRIPHAAHTPATPIIQAWPRGMTSSLSLLDSPRTPGSFIEPDLDDDDHGLIKAKVSLEDYPEFTCSICLDVLTHPVALKDCKHVFCRLCIFEMVQSCLHLGNINPSCPLCRTEIERMTDLVKQKELAEKIFGMFPEEVMQKVSTTHSLAKQKEVAANIKLLAELLFEAASADPSSQGPRGRGRSGSRGGSNASSTSLSMRPEEPDEDFLLLTVELVCLIYSIFVFLFLAWVRVSSYVL